MVNKTEKYLFGLKVGGMTGEGLICIDEPYMIIEADNEAEAKKIYCNAHGVTSYYPAELIAKTSGDIWWKITKYLSHEKIASIVEKSINN